MTNENSRNGRGNFAPQIEYKADLSKDGRFWIHRIIISVVKPITFYDAILDNKTRPGTKKTTTEEQSK